jgi:alpha-1,2-mannosyltransferase
MTAVAVLAIAGALLPWRAAFVKSAHADFDQYWYGGLVERDGGSYTDTTDVLARAARAGDHPTQDDVFGPPTIMALFFVPASYVPLGIAVRAYLVAAGVLLAFALRRAAGRWWPVWFLGLAMLPPMHLGLALGQPSLVTLSLLVLAYTFLRDDRPRAAGVTLGLAVVWKLYPAFAALGFIAHRRWRAVGAAVVTVAVAAVVSAAVLRSDIGAAIERTLNVGGVIGGYPLNWSLPGVIARISGSDAAARWASVVSLAAGGVWLVCRPSRRPQHTFALAVLVMLVAETITWSHYAPAAILAVLVVLETRSPPPVALIATAVGVGLLAWPVDRASMSIHNGWATLGSAYDLFAVVSLLIALVVLRVRPPTGDPV